MIDLAVKEATRKYFMEHDGIIYADQVALAMGSVVTFLIRVIDACEELSKEEFITEEMPDPPCRGYKRRQP